MKIRTKLLLLLMAVSIIPLVSMQFGVLEFLRELSAEIGGEVRRELVEKSSVELKRLVEDHARVLSKQRKIVELNLQQISAELSVLLEEGDAYRLPEVFSSPALSPAEAERLGKKYVRQENNPNPMQGSMQNMMGGQMADMMGGTTKINFNSVNYSSLHDTSDHAYLSPKSAREIMPLLRSVEMKNTDLILWIRAVFNSGESITYPNAVETHMGMHHPMPLMNVSATPRWTPPIKDGIVGETVVTVSVGIMSEGHAVGSVFISVPLATLLHGYNHLDMFSHHINSLLVRTDRQGQSDGVQVIAKQAPNSGRNSMMHVWEASTGQMQVPDSDKGMFAKFVEHLKNGKSGVLSMPYEGRNSIWAFSAPDKRGVSLVLILPHDDVTAPAEQAKQFVLSSTNEVLFRTGLTLAAVLLIVCILAFILSRRFTENILTLAKGVKRLATGDLTTRVHVSSKDEIGGLARDFNAMAPALQEHIEIKAALDVAMEVQTDLLPQEPPNITGYDVYGESMYCDELGGDYFDYIQPDKNSETTRFAVGDVSGHGVSAAMLMGSVRGYLRARSLSTGSLGDIITDVNRLVASDTCKTAQFMTMLMVELIPEQHALRWVRAGHEPALVFSSETDDFLRLEGEGIALGVFDDTSYPENCCAELRDGEILILGTDGIWEASNKDGEFFGKKRLWELIKANQDAPAKSIVAGIFAAVQEFTGRDKQEDDLTVVVIKKQNAKAPKES